LRDTTTDRPLSSSSSKSSPTQWHCSMSMDEAHGMVADACAGFLERYCPSRDPDDVYEYAATFGTVHINKSAGVARQNDVTLLGKRKREEKEERKNAVQNEQPSW
jgi:hypothetical protein